MRVIKISNLWSLDDFLSLKSVTRSGKNMCDYPHVIKKSEVQRLKQKCGSILSGEIFETPTAVCSCPRFPMCDAWILKNLVEDF